MGYVAPSDPVLRFALYSGLAVFLLTLLLLAAIAVLRYQLGRRERRERALAERWEPVFFHAIEGVPYAAPRSGGRERETILLLWIHFSESIRGESRERLRQLALELKLDQTARKLMARRNIRLRLMAVVAVGRLCAAAAWDGLVTLATDPNPMLSLLAARSLMQIDPVRAAPLALAELSRREDWPSAKVAAMLGAAPAEAVAPALMAALQTASAQGAPRLLAMLDTVNLGDTWPLLAPMLAPTQPPETLVAALKVCHDPRALDGVRGFTVHEQWEVRAKAAATLGRIGVAEDRLRLQAMLSDGEWWVRYRAAMALTQLPFVSRQHLETICSQLRDRFAADILRQALAETAPGETA